MSDLKIDGGPSPKPREFLTNIEWKLKLFQIHAYSSKCFLSLFREITKRRIFMVFLPGPIWDQNSARVHEEILQNIKFLCKIKKSVYLYKYFEQSLCTTFSNGACLFNLLKKGWKNSVKTLYHQLIFRDFFFSIK